MINRHTYKNSTWVELDLPSEDEISSVAEEFGIDADVARELAEPSLRQRISESGDCLFLILHFPAFKFTRNEANVQEVDFVIGKDFVVTAKYDTVDPVQKFSTLAEADSVARGRARRREPNSAFFGIMREIYASLIAEIEFIEDWIEEIERNVFTGHERDMVFALSRAGRNLLDLKKSVEQHEDILDELAALGSRKFGAEFGKGVDDVKADFEKVRHLIRSDLELVRELRDTNDSLVTTKQNEVMTLITILAFVTFPLTVVTGLFGMNVETPLPGTEHDFWFVLAIMTAMTVAMLAYFRRKRWL